MNHSTLEATIREAERFINRSRKLLRCRPATLTDTIAGQPREQGLVRRASMDLSRALADLRQGR